MQESLFRRWAGVKPGMIVLCAAIAVGGCTMTETQQRTASGAGIGAGVGAAGGALIGALTGNVGAGAAIGALSGAAVGGAGGYITDQQAQRQQAQDDSGPASPAERVAASAAGERAAAAAAATAAVRRRTGVNGRAGEREDGLRPGEVALPFDPANEPDAERGLHRAHPLALGAGRSMSQEPA